MNEFLINTFEITPEEAEIFSAGFMVKKYTKNEKFIEAGRVCNKIGFVEKGLLKCVLTGNEREVIDDFVFENQFVSNYYSFLTQQESTKNITCLEDSTLKIISREKLQELSRDHLFIEQIARKVAETLFISIHQKLEALRLQTAEERYLDLLNSHREIMDKVPQYEIASFLNVSPETVSRIRKNLTIRS